MNRRRIGFLFLWVLLCFAAGCGQAQEEKTSPEPLHKEVWSESDLLDFFNGYAYADPADRMVTACVVFPDSDWDITGVVQYTTEDDSGCGFDFIRSNGKPLRLWMDAEPSENPVLICMGKDTICTELRDAYGQTHMYTISLADENREYEFHITSE